MEVLEITPEIQNLILKGGSEEEVFAVGRKNGFLTMKEDAIFKALEHQIPFEEISNFGTKVGIADDDQEFVSVDNQKQTTEEV